MRLPPLSPSILLEPSEPPCCSRARYNFYADGNEISSFAEALILIDLTLGRCGGICMNNYIIFGRDWLGDFDGSICGALRVLGESSNLCALIVDEMFELPNAKRYARPTYLSRLKPYLQLLIGS